MADLTEEQIANLKEQIIQRITTGGALINFQNLIRDKDITIFLGNTRSGKSTLINCLLGNTMRSVRREEFHRQFQLELLDDDDGPRIGNGSLSVTDCPTVYTTEHDGIYIDSPGFEDNRGIQQDIFNALCVNKIRFAKSIKFVMVCYIYDLVSDNIRSFTSLLSQMSHLVTNIENIQNSVCIIFTKDRENYTSEELRTIMTNIVNLHHFDIDRNLLRNLTVDSNLIGLFKMPTREGVVNFNELNVNIGGAIDACEQVAVGELNIRFALSDQSNLFLKAVYPEYIDTVYFETEINRTVQEYNPYFNIDLYVYASYDEELQGVIRQLNALRANLNLERNINSLDDLQRSLETFLKVRQLRLSYELETSFQFIIALDNALLFEENHRETVIRNYNNSMDALLLKVDRLKTKIDDEYETRRKNRMSGLFQASLFAGGIGPATMGILRFVQAMAPRGMIIPGATGFTTLEAGIGTVAATSACVVGGIAVGGALGAAYMLVREAIFRRREARADQGRS